MTPVGPTILPMAQPDVTQFPEELIWNITRYIGDKTAFALSNKTMKRAVDDEMIDLDEACERGCFYTLNSGMEKTKSSSKEYCLSRYHANLLAKSGHVRLILFMVQHEMLDEETLLESPETLSFLDDDTISDLWQYKKGGRLGYKPKFRGSAEEKLIRTIRAIYTGDTAAIDDQRPLSADVVVKYANFIRDKATFDHLVRGMRGFEVHSPFRHGNKFRPSYWPNDSCTPANMTASEVFFVHSSDVDTKRRFLGGFLRDSSPTRPAARVRVALFMDAVVSRDYDMIEMLVPLLSMPDFAHFYAVYYNITAIVTIMDALSKMPGAPSSNDAPAWGQQTTAWDCWRGMFDTFGKKFLDGAKMTRDYKVCNYVASEFWGVTADDVM